MKLPASERLNKRLLADEFFPRVAAPRTRSPSASASSAFRGPRLRCYSSCAENSTIYTIFLNKNCYLLYTVAQQTASSTTPADAESSALDDGDRSSPSPDGDAPDRDRSEALIELLANARRRYLWEHLRREEREISLQEASEVIAGRELDKPPSAVTYDERKSVYTSLRQFHCPKMADAGLIEFDRRAGRVAPCEGSDLVVELEPDRSRVRATVLGAVGLSTLVTGAAWRLDLPVFGALSLEALAVSLGIAAAVACALYYSVVRSARAVDFDEVLRRLR